MPESFMRGTYPALVTPFVPGGLRSALDAIPPMIERLAAKGVDGVFICGTTGQGANLGGAEKIEIMQAVAGVAKGRIEVWAQISCAEWPDTLGALEAAKQLELTGVSALQPWYYGVDVEAQFAWHAAVAERCEGLPLYLYNIPQCAGNHIAIETMQRLLDRFDCLCGIKESASPADVRRWLPLQNERFQVTCGVDTIVCEMLKNGCGANVTSFGNIVPGWFVEIHKAAREGDWPRAMQWQTRLNALIERWDGPNLIPTILEALRCAGLESGAPRPPIRELSDEERAAVKQVVEEFDID